ncbi:amidase [Acinetobacter qingfengensis]|uniref:Amidase n=1 Tax=Acinetobacter qingfengensis TaxID=1262585 RepID=A0A1E7R365_9GAMM|nr:amidase [Acinetobacter qingfengensis]KAA8734706.1 amidase [Acinetobacter qingfengensis]OEY93798.1 amidase [Acinetobacter qingfengensis]
MIVDALGLVKKFAEGSTTPLIELEKSIVEINFAKSIFISKSLDRAYREAKASTERWKNACPLSSFDGVTIAWKDLIDVAGMVTTAGAKIFKHHPPAQHDAGIVSALTRMGMVNIGKTNLTEFAYSGLGLNPHFGTPENVVDPKCIPGGSSSGSAVAVGNGIVKISMGTDTAGSIRIPSAFNGVVGYRSSCARYPKDGVFPLASSLDTLGPLATSVRDCYVLDCLLHGQANVQLPKYPLIRQLKFFVDLDLLEDPAITIAVKNNFLHSIERLARAGAYIEYHRISAIHETLALIDDGKWLGAAEAFTLHEDLLNSDAAQQIDLRVRSRLETARDLPASIQIKLYTTAKRLKHLLEEELCDGFLLSPTVAHTAPLREPLEQNDTLFFQTNARTLRLTMPGSFLDMPCLTLPNGSDKYGLPTALLISGICNQDQKVLHAALAVEQVLAGAAHK